MAQCQVFTTEAGEEINSSLEYGIKSCRWGDVITQGATFVSFGKGLDSPSAQVFNLGQCTITMNAELEVGS